MSHVMDDDIKRWRARRKSAADAGQYPGQNDGV